MKPKLWLLAGLGFVLLLCIALLPILQKVFTGFPESLLGAVALSPPSKPLPANAYHSAEFVLNQVPPSNIEKAVYINLHEDVLFWEPHYVGFARTQLTAEEIRQVQQLLTAGNLFSRPSNGGSYQCVRHDPAQKPQLAPCAQGKQWADQYENLKWDSQQKGTTGVLQFFLKDGRLAEFRVYPSPDGLAYTPYQVNGDWWLDGVTAPAPVLAGISSRAALAPIAVLWPELPAAQANQQAERFLGRPYRSARTALQNSSTLRQVIGEVQEIRPAAGNNYRSNWMDANSLTLTLRVIGSRGEGAVLLRGQDCLDVQMVFQGQSVKRWNERLCP